MKCPKCHYLSFDPEPRCRNCGYTLALDSDLAMERDEVPLVDLALRDQAGSASAADARERTSRSPDRRQAGPKASQSGARARSGPRGPFDDASEPDSADRPDPMDAATHAGHHAGVGSPPEPDVLVPVEGATRASAPEKPRRAAERPLTAELPLFVRGLAPTESSGWRDDETEPERPDDDDKVDSGSDPLRPFGAPPAYAPPKRQAGGRTGEPRLGPLDRDLLDGLERLEDAERREAAAKGRERRREGGSGPGRRLGAALVDAVLMGGMAAAILSLTLHWADLSWEQWSMIPVVPMSTFILVLVLGYLFIFTAAGGQTVGKMVAGIRVVDAGVSGEGRDRVSAGQTLKREALAIPAVLLGGAGFIPALFGAGRAVHDRLSGTRVVRA